MRCLRCAYSIMLLYNIICLSNLFYNKAISQKRPGVVLQRVLNNVFLWCNSFGEIFRQLKLFFIVHSCENAVHKLISEINVYNKNSNNLYIKCYHNKFYLYIIYHPSILQTEAYYYYYYYYSCMQLNQIKYCIILLLVWLTSLHTNFNLI